MSVLSTILIDHERFLRFVNLFDRAIGKVEPINRKVYFYAKTASLRAYGTDGCLTVNMNLGRIEHFDGFYVVPLDDLKLISSRETGEDVEIDFGTTLRFSKGAEFLSILHPISRDPRRKGSFTPEFSIEASDLSRVIDSGSIISREGQQVLLGAWNGRLFTLSEEYGHIGMAMMNFEAPDFAFEIPYETARHLVKALDVIKKEKIVIGYAKNLLGLRFTDGVFVSCALPAEEQVSRINEIFEMNDENGVEISVKILKDATSLCASFQRRNGGMGYLELSDMMRFSVLSQSSAYEYVHPIETREPVRVSVVPRKLHQFLSRFREKNAFVGVTKEYVLFKGRQAFFAIKRER